MKKIVLMLFVGLCFFVMKESEAKTIKSELTGIIDARKSSPNTTAFPSGAVSDDEIETLMWAATGRNKNGSYTVPLAKSQSPYVNVYVARGSGVFRYDYEKGILVKVSDKDIRREVSPQGLGKVASDILIFTLTGKTRSDFEWVAVGSMTQNVYLVATDLGIGVRYLATLNRDVIVDTLKLSGGEAPAALMPLGK